MPCMWVIFIVVGVGVWILVTVFRKAEEERQKNLPRPGGDGARGPVRRGGTDLDRFLEEARRRRDAGERPQPAPDAQWVVPVAKPAARRSRDIQRPPVVTRPQAPQRTGERPPAFVPSVRRSASEHRADMQDRPPPPMSPSRPAPSPVVLEIVPDDVATPAIGLPPDKQTGPPPLALGGVLSRPASTVSPILKQLPNLLRDPQSVGAVFLREIFGPPLCRRYSLPTNALPPRS